MKIGVIVAMEKEFVQLRQLLESTSQVEIHGLQLVEGRMGNHEIVLMRCGIGKVNSAIGAVELIRHCHPGLVVSTGVAGGADVALRVMDVVVSTECVYHDVYCGSECAMGQVMGLPATYISLPPSWSPRLCGSMRSWAESPLSGQGRLSRVIGLWTVGRR